MVNWASQIAAYSFSPLFSKLVLWSGGLWLIPYKLLEWAVKRQGQRLNEHGCL